MSKSLPIWMYGTWPLTHKCDTIDKDNPIVKDMADQMIATVKSTDTGVGISAPQVGYTHRMFVMCDAQQENFQVFINPEIIALKGSKKKELEGCLSIPKIHLTVERFQKVRIKYYDENWVEHTKLFKGLEARIIQHEFDHLDGIQFIDHLSERDRKIIDKTLHRMQEGDFPKVEYETVKP